MVRGNIAFNFGSGGVGVFVIDKVSTYHNTFYKMTQQLSGSQGNVLTFYRPSNQTNNTIDNLIANTIIQDYGLINDAIYVQSGSGVSQTKNLGYLAGTEASYVSTSDPLFISPTAPTRNFRLNAGSPAINTGTNIATVTSASSSGTTFNISDGLLFIDGWGMVDGDTVTVGGTTTHITAISGNAVTVANSVTWTLGAPIYWGTDTTPDIGALPYGSTELTAAVMQQVGTVYTVVATGDARGVWFYADGIPNYWDNSSPYTFTNASTVTAKVYALNAQASPIVTATAEVAPTLTAIVDQSLAKNGTLALTLAMSDDVTASASLEVTAASANHTLMDDEDCVVAWNGSAWVLTMSPNINQIGTSVVTVRSTDEGGLYSERTFTLSVNDVPFPNQTGASPKAFNRRAR